MMNSRVEKFSRSLFHDLLRYLFFPPGYSVGYLVLSLVFSLSLFRNCAPPSFTRVSINWRFATRLQCPFYRSDSSGREDIHICSNYHVYIHYAIVHWLALQRAAREERGSLSTRRSVLFSFYRICWSKLLKVAVSSFLSWNDHITGWFEDVCMASVVFPSLLSTT